MKKIVVGFLCLVVFSFVCSSCNTPVLTDKGDQLLDTLSYRYSCGEVFSRETQTFDLSSNAQDQSGIHVYFKKCQDSLSYVTVMNNVELVSRIASKVFEARTDTKKFVFVTLEFNEISKGGKSHRFTFSPDASGKLVLTESK